MNNQTNFSLVERVKGHGPAIDQDELIDLLGELDAWRDAACDCGISSPGEIESALSDAECCECT